MGEPAVDFSQSEEVEGTNTELPEEHSIWNDETLERVKEFAETTEEIKTARAALNATLAAGKAKLIDDGFNKDALEAAIKYARTEDDKRQNFDLTYLYCRKALGHPVQDDLFVEATKQQIKIAK